jgi:hypothetical protein
MSDPRSSHGTCLSTRPTMRSAPYDLSISATRASASFASPLQRPDEPGARQIRRAIATVIGVCGVRGCAAPTRGSGHRRGPNTGEDGAGGAAGRPARRRRGEPGARPGAQGRRAGPGRDLGAPGLRGYGRDMPGRPAADPALLGARISESCCLWLYNSQVLANATGLGCNCSDDVLTSRRTHMSGMSPEVSVNE